MDMTRRYRCPSCGDIITEEEYPTDCTPGEMQAAMLLDAIRDPDEYNPHEDGNYIIRLAERIEKERRSRWYIK